MDHLLRNRRLEPILGSSLHFFSKILLFYFFRSTWKQVEVLNETSTVMDLWIFTEELPRRETLAQIIDIYQENYLGLRKRTPRDLVNIKAVLRQDGTFTKKYQITDIVIDGISNIHLTVVSGASSFVDYLIFRSEVEPDQTSVPLMAIEETKTDSREGRNVAAYQRGAKFVHLDNCYKGQKIAKYMYYTHQGDEIEANASVLFGMKLKIFNGVSIIGKNLPLNCNSGWKSIEELIQEKNSFAKQFGGSNVPLRIWQSQKGVIYASARLAKKEKGKIRLSHDPNIGYVLLLASALRKLGYRLPLVIMGHGITQDLVNMPNKFTINASRLGVQLEGLKIPDFDLPDFYWHTEETGEKITTIFLHLALERMENSSVIYSNHAGCERGYFETCDGQHLAVEKSTPLPDLIGLSSSDLQIANIEGKKSSEKSRGLRQIENFDRIERIYIRRFYPGHRVRRGVVLYGGVKDHTSEKIWFQIMKNGTLLVSESAPEFLKQAVGRFIA